MNAAPGRATKSLHRSLAHEDAQAGAVLFRRARTIRFSDCDPAGIVFYPQYFVLFNGLVEDWVTDELQIGYAALIGGRRIGLPTVHLEADFSGVSRMGDTVDLALAVQRLGTRSLTLALSCRGRSGELRMAMRQVLVTTSLQTHEAIDLPADLRAAITARMQPTPPQPPESATP